MPLAPAARAGPLQGQYRQRRGRADDGVVKWVAADPALASTDEQGAYLRKTVLNGVADEFRERQAGRRLRTVSSTRPPTTGWP